MKTIALLTLTLLTFACAPTDIVTKGMDNEASLNSFLTQFEKSVKAHDQKGVMDAMDNSYRFEQHDDMMKGNTQQFLKEFFCGSDAEGEYKCSNLEDISHLERISEKMKDNIVFLVYNIHLKDGSVIKSDYWQVSVKMQTGSNKIFGLIGAAG